MLRESADDVRRDAIVRIRAPPEGMRCCGAASKGYPPQKPAPMGGPVLA